MEGTPIYIAWRYLVAKKGSTAVSFITFLAAVAMMVAVAAMFIIVSVFSGLEDLNRDMVKDLHADLTVKSTRGKQLGNIRHVEQVLKQDTAVAFFSKIIEEKVYVNYGDAGEIANLRAVDSAYALVNPIDKSIFYGTFPSFKYSNEVLMENSLDVRLSLPVGNNQSATVMMPKPGLGIISKEEDIFNKKEIYVTGVFPGNEQLNNYIIAPLELAEELLNLPKKSAYEIVVKLKNENSAKAVKKRLEKHLGKKAAITTKEEENAAFWKMINTEKIFIYLIFALVIFITTFNLAGAIVILQLDKKEQAKTLVFLGLPVRQLRNIYFYTGLLIVFFGIVTGLAAGTLACWLQIETGFFMAGTELPFPVRIVGSNYLIVGATAVFFGFLISLYFSKIKNININ